MILDQLPEIENGEKEIEHDEIHDKMEEYTAHVRQIVSIKPDPDEEPEIEMQSHSLEINVIKSESVEER